MSGGSKEDVVGRMGGEGKETIRGNLVLGAWTLSFKGEPTTVWFEPGGDEASLTFSKLSASCV